MASNNPIDLGIIMADQILAAHNIVPARLRITEVHPPTFTLKAQLERSLLFEQIKDAQAKLEALRIKEAELRDRLVAEYGSIAYEAERAKFKLETRTWQDGVTLAANNERVEDALEAHTDCLNDIDYAKENIADQQHDLDDSALWEQEGGAA